MNEVKVDAELPHDVSIAYNDDGATDPVADETRYEDGDECKGRDDEENITVVKMDMNKRVQAEVKNDRDERAKKSKLKPVPPDCQCAFPGAYACAACSTLYPDTKEARVQGAVMSASSDEAGEAWRIQQCRACNSMCESSWHTLGQKVADAMWLPVRMSLNVFYFTGMDQTVTARATILIPAERKQATSVKYVACHSKLMSSLLEPSWSVLLNAMTEQRL